MNKRLKLEWAFFRRFPNLSGVTADEGLFRRPEKNELLDCTSFWLPCGFDADFARIVAWDPWLGYFDFGKCRYLGITYSEPGFHSTGRSFNRGCYAVFGSSDQSTHFMLVSVRYPDSVYSVEAQANSFNDCVLLDNPFHADCASQPNEKFAIGLDNITSVTISRNPASQLSTLMLSYGESSATNTVESVVWRDGLPDIQVFQADKGHLELALHCNYYGVRFYGLTPESFHEVGRKGDFMGMIPFGYIKCLGVIPASLTKANFV